MPTCCVMMVFLQVDALSAGIAFAVALVTLRQFLSAETPGSVGGAAPMQVGPWHRLNAHHEQTRA